MKCEEDWAAGLKKTRFFSIFFLKKREKRGWEGWFSNSGFSA